MAHPYEIYLIGEICRRWVKKSHTWGNKTHFLAETESCEWGQLQNLGEASKTAYRDRIVQLSWRRLTALKLGVNLWSLAGLPCTYAKRSCWLAKRASEDVRLIGKSVAVEKEGRVEEGWNRVVEACSRIQHAQEHFLRFAHEMELPFSL